METKKRVLDLTEISTQIGALVERQALPDGKEMVRSYWEKEHFYKAMELFEPYRKEPDTILLVTNSPAPWVTMGIMLGMKPLVVNYLYPRPDGVELEFSELKRGKQDDNYNVAFEIVEEGEKLFINMTSDAANLGIHSFETEKLSKVMIPEIPAGKDVFIHGKGMFCVMVWVGLSYVPDSRSVSIAFFESDYVCGYSSDPAREVGDAEKRTLPNNL